ncbi:uncharacterized protein PHALS_05125 [Plasmopara halstedii]|uniref:Uncharacterized protein n=1 Tax=Plasmopara halstedii TaxID=4781 RepID=A0A0P1B2T8_PLAHL|nr:uncharacterized protein PHALS_05125 [Plasmopara halstedii]CEG47789.1 hypothetical protein PHALS_05125 [Plasmopara halstedii]|eukprot:XP_024584158.1 hypothetical protein PHALS_05125 [Plasmopara halstedii]
MNDLMEHVRSDEEIKFIAGGLIPKLLMKSKISEKVQQQLLTSNTELSTVFAFLMREASTGSLDQFFDLKLHIPLLSYACKICDPENIEKFNADAVAKDVTRLLTEKRKGGDLITWLGTYGVSETTKDIDRLVRSFSQNEKTFVLAYRLYALVHADLVPFHCNYDWISPPNRFVFWLRFAAFTRFNYIEHEARFPEFMKLQVRKFMGDQYFENDHLKLLMKDLEGLFKEVAKRAKLFRDFDWSQIDDNQIRLYKAALSSEDNAKLMREALMEKSHAAAFKEKLNDKKMEETFEALLIDKKLVESLQKVLKDENQLSLLHASFEGLKDPVYSTSILKKVDMNHDQASLNDDRLKLFEKAVETSGRLTLVEDMLSSTELDPVKPFQAILSDQKKVELLKEALRDEEHLNKFRLVLDSKSSKNSEYELESELVDKEWAKKFDMVLKDMNLVFFLRVAVLDNDRAKLFKAALEEQAQFQVFEKEEKQLHNLKMVVSYELYWEFKHYFDFIDRTMLGIEMVKWLKDKALNSFFCSVETSV